MKRTLLGLALGASALLGACGQNGNNPSGATPAEAGAAAQAPPRDSTGADGPADEEHPETRDPEG